MGRTASPKRKVLTHPHHRLVNPNLFSGIQVDFNHNPEIPQKLTVDQEKEEENDPKQTLSAS